MARGTSFGMLAQNVLAAKGLFVGTGQAMTGGGGSVVSTKCCCLSAIEFAWANDDS